MHAVKETRDRGEAAIPEWSYDTTVTFDTLWSKYVPQPGNIIYGNDVEQHILEQKACLRWL